MNTKQKLSITIDSDVFAALNAAARARQVSRSQLAQEAFRFWLKNKERRLMAKGYEDMAKEDREFADLAFGAQKEIVA